MFHVPAHKNAAHPAAQVAIVVKPACRGAIENLKSLSPHDQERVRRVASSAAFWNLDNAQAYLISVFPGWFVYRGGSHVALHRGASRLHHRVLLVTQQ